MDHRATIPRAGPATVFLLRFLLVTGRQPACQGPAIFLFSEDYAISE